MTIPSICQAVVRLLREEDRPLLESMYNTFAPLAAAQGLPPYAPAERSAWLAKLRQGINLVAFVEDRLVAHLALVSMGDGVEMTCFVHQDFRRQGVATALTAMAVEKARTAGYRSITVFIDTHNVAARHGLLKFGFQPVWEDLEEGEYAYPLNW